MALTLVLCKLIETGLFKGDLMFLHSMCTLFLLSLLLAPCWLVLSSLRVHPHMFAFCGLISVEIGAFKRNSS